MAAALVALALAIAPGATWASEPKAGPGPLTIARAVEPGAEAPAKEGESGFPDLPFKGADVVALVVVALSLVAAGAAVRRLT